MLLYLALGMTTTMYALRQSLDMLLMGEDDPPFTRRRQVGGRVVARRGAVGAAQTGGLGVGSLHVPAR
jgi:hypothetical protein